MLDFALKRVRDFLKIIVCDDIIYFHRYYLFGIVNEIDKTTVGPQTVYVGRF